VTPVRQPDRSGNDARRIALGILNKVDTSRLTLDRILEETLAGHAAISQRDKSLLMNIVWGVLRWRGRLDWIIKHFSNTPIQKIDARILNILRMGIFQMVHLDRIPESAAVNTSVGLAKQVAAPHVVKYVNAVLRNASRAHSQVPLPDPKADPVLALAVEHALPHWLIKRWIKRFGVDETRELCAAINDIPPVTLRTNTQKTSRDELVCALKEKVKHIEITANIDFGIRLFGLHQGLEKLDIFRRGWFQVQDEAAQLVTLFFNPRPGDNILDACAGMGGKTGHIAQQLNGQGRVTALDHSAYKLERLQDEMARLGFDTVSTQVHDLNQPFSSMSKKGYDRVLLDAPCSGLGVLRRNPDAKWSSRPEDLARKKKRQIRFLSGLAPVVRPGGVLVYAVCSPEPEETDQVVDTFLKTHSDFVVDPPSDPLWASGLLDEKGYLRTFPHRHNMDGFFAARFKKLKRRDHGMD
jgi:16S rRNA (cytosine967-C5)-methyltransferase